MGIFNQPENFKYILNLNIFVMHIVHILSILCPTGFRQQPLTQRLRKSQNGENAQAETEKAEFEYTPRRARYNAGLGRFAFFWK